MTELENGLREYMRTLPVVSTHSHQYHDAFFEDFDLTRLLADSYTAWLSAPPDFADLSACEAYLKRYRVNGFFRWLFASLEELYGIPVTAESLAAVDAAVRERHKKNPDTHLDILRESCRFERVIVERQADPGSDLGHPELFRPSFRCDCFFSGYVDDLPEPNGFLARSLFDEPEVSDIGGYLSQMRAAVLRKKREGCVALKVAMAYERPLDFDTPDLALAARALNSHDALPLEKKAFGDAVMFELAKISAELDMTLQLHTGTGQLRGTNPLRLLTLIESNPDTRFHLLHGGYPWTADTFALLLAYRNVFSDTCWLPYLSLSAAVRYLVEALERADAHRLTWGCDCWVSEDSYGALLAMERALPRALAQMITDGAIDRPYAEYIIKRIMHDNAGEIFPLLSCEGSK